MGVLSQCKNMGGGGGLGGAGGGGLSCVQHLTVTSLSPFQASGQFQFRAYVISPTRGYCANPPLAQSPSHHPCMPYPYLQYLVGIVHVLDARTTHHSVRIATSLLSMARVTSKKI